MMTPRRFLVAALLAAISLPASSQDAPLPGDSRPALPLPDTQPELAAVSSLAARELDFDFAANTAALVDASISFSDKEGKQKLTFSPLKLLRPPGKWDGWTVGAANGGGTSTFSSTFSYDWSASYDRCASSIVDEFNKKSLPPLLPKSDEADGVFEERVKNTMAVQYEEYWKRRYTGKAAFGLTSYVQTFSNLAAAKVDLDNDGKVDNAFATKAYGASLQVLLRFSDKTALTLTASAGKNRNAAVEQTPLRSISGAGLSVATLLKILNSQYLVSADYRKKLYVPSLVGGLSLEWKRCEGKSTECDNGIVEEYVGTPFLDLRLPGGAQFRLGLPFKKDRVGDKSGTDLRILAQLGWVMASL